MRALKAFELIEILKVVPPNFEVAALYDCECAGGSVVGVRCGPHPDERGTAVLLVVE